MDDIMNINKVSNKIHSHFMNKYPKFFPSLGMTVDDIAKIFTTKNIKLNDRNSFDKVVSAIDSKVLQRMHSPKTNKGYAAQTNILPTPKAQLQTSSYVQDTNIKIKPEEYLKNFNPILNEPPIQIDDLKYENQFKEQSEDFPYRERQKLLEMMKPETEKKEYFIIIDSKDRNMTSFPKVNEFAFHFGPSDGETTGYIDVEFNNVYSIELVEAIVVKTSDTAGASDNGTNIPYIIVEIDEIGGLYYGTNTPLSKAFAILTNSNLGANGFRYFLLPGYNSNNNVIKTFNRNRKISKMTFKFKKPDGELFEFGTTNDEATNTIINLTFKLTIIEQNLKTLHLDASGM
jgi:hypothetical protein